MGLATAVAIRQKKPPKSRLPISKTSNSTPPSTLLNQNPSETSSSIPRLTTSSPYRTSTVITRSGQADRACCQAVRESRHQSVPATHGSARVKPAPVKSRIARLNTATTTPVSKMAYQPPEPHIMVPCTQKSLVHRLACSHLVITPKPIKECARNCAGGSSSMFSLRSIAPNPRDLDITIICPLCDSVPPASKTGWRKKPNVLLVQVIWESVLPVSNNEGRRKTAKPAPDGNPLGFGFPGCTPDKRVDSLIGGHDMTVERPRRSVTGQKTLRPFQLLKPSSSESL